jgi:hypothetical protein
MVPVVFPVLPVWVEKIILQAIKSYLPAEVVRQVWQGLLVSLGEWAKALAADTTNKVDDAIAAAVADLATGNCLPDTQVLCDVIQRGEKAAVEFLRAQALRTDTKLDDAMVDVIASALGVAKA